MYILCYVVLVILTKHLAICAIFGATCRITDKPSIVVKFFVDRYDMASASKGA